MQGVLQITAMDYIFQNAGYSIDSCFLTQYYVLTINLLLHITTKPIKTQILGFVILLSCLYLSKSNQLFWEVFLISEQSGSHLNYG